MNHTPGPWKWDGNFCDYDPEETPWLVLDLDGDTTEILYGEIHCDNPANARLIAAAPDLYEALYRLLCNCPTGPEYDDEGLYQAAMERAREAILKVGAA